MECEFDGDCNSPVVIIATHLYRMRNTLRESRVDNDKRFTWHGTVRETEASLVRSDTSPQLGQVSYLLDGFVGADLHTQALVHS